VQLRSTEKLSVKAKAMAKVRELQMAMVTVILEKTQDSAEHWLTLPWRPRLSVIVG
jgi:hypothetical protein